MPVGDREGGAAALAEVQADLYDLITAPEGVAKRLAELGRSASDLESLVKPTVGLSGVARLDIYANMYFFRILDVLRDEYPKLAAALGDNAFHNLVTEYLVACRPAHPSLREAGARLPEFLGQHPLVTEGQRRGWLAELARLERTRHELYDGPDAETLELDVLRLMSPDALSALWLVAIPCHAVLGNRFCVSRRWKDLEAGASGGVVVVAQTPETLLVWRRGLDVYHRAVDPDEARLLALVRGGTRFEIVCEALLGETACDSSSDLSLDVSSVAERAFQLIGRWVNDGLIAAPSDDRRLA